MIRCSEAPHNVHFVLMKNSNKGQKCEITGLTHKPGAEMHVHIQPVHKIQDNQLHTVCVVPAIWADHGSVHNCTRPLTNQEMTHISFNLSSHERSKLETIDRNFPVKFPSFFQNCHMTASSKSGASHVCKNYVLIEKPCPKPSGPDSFYHFCIQEPDSEGYTTLRRGTDIKHWQHTYGTSSATTQDSQDMMSMRLDFKGQWV